MTWNVRMKNKFEFHDRICASSIFYFFFIRLSFFACSTWPQISNDSCLVLTHILASCALPPMINVNPCKCLISSFFCLASRGLCRSPAEEDVNTKHNNLSHHGKFANSSSSTQKREKRIHYISQPTIHLNILNWTNYIFHPHSFAHFSLFFAPFFLPPLLLHPQWHLGFSSVYVMWAGVIRTTAEEFTNSACEQRTTTCVWRLRWAQSEQMKAFFSCCWMDEIFHIFSSSRKKWRALLLGAWVRYQISHGSSALYIGARTARQHNEGAPRQHVSESVKKREMIGVHHAGSRVAELLQQQWIFEREN